MSVIDVDAEALRVIERAAQKRLPRTLTAQSQVVAKLLARSLLEVAPNTFVTLRDKAIRDPFDGATRVVTVRVNASA